MERHQQREQLAAIEREAGELWKEVERSHLKTQFAREILRAAEDEHVTRKGQYDAIAARLEDAIRTTNDAEETFKRREAAFFAATGRQARPESRPQHPRRTGVPPQHPQPPPPHRPPAPAHPRALPTDFLQTQPRQSNTPASASSSQNGSRPTSPPPPPTAQRANGDVDFLSDGYEKGYIKEKSSSGSMSSWIPFVKKKKEKEPAPQPQPQQQQQPTAPPQQPTAPPLMRFPEVEENPPDVSGFGASLNGAGAGGGVLRATSSGGGFSSREGPPDIFREDAPAETTTTTSPPSSPPSQLQNPVPSPGLRASVQTEDELARVAAVERSRREAEEARAVARAAREQREAAAAANAAAAAEDPAIAAQAARAREFATAGSSGNPSGEISAPAPASDLPPAFADFADFDSAAAAGASGFSGGKSPGADVVGSAPASPTEPEGPPSVNTAHDLAREAMRRDVEPFLPRAHEPRAGLTEHQRRLGPPAGEFCLPRFCSQRCVAASCAAFIRACGSNPDVDIDLADVGGITRQLRKITIRNHPDRNSVARVGELKSAKATVLTQQATFLESMLEDHEYVAVRAGVDASALAGTNGGDAGPPSADSTSVVLNRVHLASTVEQLRDLVVEERPELAEARDRLAVGMTRAPGLPETRLHFGHGVGAVTLRDLEVDRETVFRVWVQTEAEMEWEMFSR